MAVTEVQASDNWARDLASEAKELAVRVAAQQEAHERACDERHANMSRWQEESVRTRHDMRNDMLAGFGELRSNIASVAGAAQVNADNATNRWMAVAGAAILALLGIVGYLIANKGL